MLGNYTTEPSEYTTFFKGIKDAADIPVYWAKGCELLTSKGMSGFTQRSARTAAMRADLVVLVVGIHPGLEGEENDTRGVWGHKGDKPSINLPDCQMELYRNMKSLGKPVIVVHVSGSCMNLSEFADSSDALLQCFYPGELGGEALADILFGKASPSGRLPVTFYASDDDLPAFDDYSMENRTYRFFKGTPLYPFGYGLSYTKFDYTDIVVKDNAVTVRVTNSGKMAGADAVLLYGKKNGIFELIGFEKVELAEGQSNCVDICFEGEYSEFRLGADLFVNR